MSEKRLEKQHLASASEGQLDGSLQFLLLEDVYWTRKAIGLGFLGTVLVHLFAVYFIGAGQSNVERPAVFNPYNSFEIELVAAPLFEPESLNFVSTDKNVEDSLPEDTSNRSARDQQAAQEDAPKTIDPFNRPTSEGRFNRESHESITGTIVPEGNSEEILRPSFLQKPPLQSSISRRRLKETFPEPISESDPEQSLPEDTVEEETESPLRIEEVVEKEQEIVDSPPEPTEIVEIVEETPEDIEPVLDELVQPVEEYVEPEAIPFDPILNPRPRPRLYRVTDTAVLTNLSGVMRRGRTALDAIRDITASYNEKLKDDIYLEWNRLSVNERTLEGEVKIRFTLNKKGWVEKVEVLESTMATREESLCKEAIIRGQPYEKWNEKMVHLYGSSREVTYTFFYDPEE